MPSIGSPLVYAADTDKDAIRRARLRGQLVRLAPGIYTSEVSQPAADVVRARIWDVVGHQFPGAVIADRSARDGGLSQSGTLYVVEKTHESARASWASRGAT